MESQAFLTTFEVAVEGNEEPISGVLPATAYPIGFPLFITSINADTGQKTLGLGSTNAVHNTSETITFAGFLLRASQTVATGIGSSTNNLLFGLAETGGALDTPYEVSKPGAVKKYKEIIVEGSAYIDTATSNYAISSSTAVGAALTLRNGLWVVCYDSADEIVLGRLMAQLTPVTAGNVRIQIRVLSDANAWVTSAD